MPAVLADRQQSTYHPVAPLQKVGYQSSVELIENVLGIVSGYLMPKVLLRLE